MLLWLIWLVFGFSFGFGLIWFGLVWFGVVVSLAKPLVVVVRF